MGGEEWDRVFHWELDTLPGEMELRGVEVGLVEVVEGLGGEGPF